MPKFYILFIVFTMLFISCDRKANDTFEGDFIYIADAAVLKGKHFIYGVEIDSMAMKLAEQSEVFKKDDFDMVPVSIVGELHEKRAGVEGWDTIIKIKEIIAVGNAKVKQYH
ncbi:MAG: hypothetical protein WA951_06915 [Leeuwenhoekiella sp.]